MTIQHTDLSIGIISRFRSNSLQECLLSIASQTMTPLEIIIVHDRSDVSTKKILNKFDRLNIKIIYYNKSGYAEPRNLLIENCQTNYLYMVDDDCVLSKHNLSNIIAYLKFHPSKIAVQGRSSNYDTSFYSQFMQWTFDLSSKRMLKKGFGPTTIDTKNVVLNISKIKDKYKFNECYGSEDIDFGLQLASQGEKIGVCNKVHNIHFESTNNIIDFIRKKTRMRKGRSYIIARWGKTKNYTFCNTDLDYLNVKFNKSKYHYSLKYHFIFRILTFIRSVSDQYFRLKSKPKKILCVTSPGGHLYQMMLLKKWWSQHQRIWISANTPDVKYLLKNEVVYLGNFPENANLVNALRNLLLAIKIFIKERPAMLISTGAGIAPPFFLIAKIIGVKSVFIETLDFIYHGSLSGRLVYPISSMFFVQHKTLLKKYPKAKYIGSLL